MLFLTIEILEEKIWELTVLINLTTSKTNYNLPCNPRFLFYVNRNEELSRLDYRGLPYLNVLIKIEVTIGKNS